MRFILKAAIAALSLCVSAPGLADYGKFLFVLHPSERIIATYLVEGGLLRPRGYALTGPEPQTVAVAPDGASVYVANRGSRDVSVFRLHGDSGWLEPLESSIKLPAPPSALAIAPGGNALYAASIDSGSLFRFVIAADGRLSQPEAFHTGFGSISALAVSKDAKLVFVTSGTSNALKAIIASSGHRHGLEIPTGRSPRAIVLHPGGRLVFVANEAGSDCRRNCEMLSAYRIHPETGLIRRLPGYWDRNRSLRGVVPGALAIHPGGSSMYVTFRSLLRTPEGSSGPGPKPGWQPDAGLDAWMEPIELAIGQDGALAKMPGGLQIKPGASSIVVDPSGRFVFAVHPDAMALTAMEVGGDRRKASAPARPGPAALALAAGKTEARLATARIYSTGFSVPAPSSDLHRIASYRPARPGDRWRDGGLAQGGELPFADQTFEYYTAVHQTHSLAPRAPAIEPYGRYAYFGGDHGICAMTLDAEGHGKERINSIESYSNQFKVWVEQPRWNIRNLCFAPEMRAMALAADPSGRFIYAADEFGKVSAFRIDLDGNAKAGFRDPVPMFERLLQFIPGGLIPINTLQVGAKPRPKKDWGKGSGSGTGEGGAGDAEPTDKPGQSDEWGGPANESLTNIKALAVDPTGRHLYAVGHSADQKSAFVSGFSIDPVTGALTVMERAVVAILAGRFEHLAIEPHGRFIYVANTKPNGTDVQRPADIEDSRIFIFERNRASGALSERPDFDLNAMGDKTTKSLAVDATGRFLYAANFGSKTLSTLKIDQATGGLHPIGTGSRPAHGLPRSLMIDSAGRALYSLAENPSPFDGAGIFTYHINMDDGRLDRLGRGDVGAPGNFPALDMLKKIE